MSELPSSLISRFSARSARSPTSPAFTFVAQAQRPAATLTVQELEESARMLAGFVQGRVAPGSRVLLMLPHRPEFIVAFMACLHAGVIAVPVVLPRNAAALPRLAGISDAVDAALLLTDAPSLQRLQELAAETGASLPAPPCTLEEARAAPAAPWRAPGLDERSVAFLQFTSGSTGSPKGVTVTHGNLLHNLGLLESALGLPSGAPMVSWLPFFHDWGLIGCVLFPLYAGLHCVVLDPLTFLYRPLRWLQSIDEHRAAISCAPTFAYELCLTAVTDAERQDLDLSTWQVAMVGAEPVRSRALRGFSDRFASAGFREDAFYPTYGLAEGTLIVSGNVERVPPTRLTLDKRAFSLGRVVPLDAPSGDGSTSLVGCGRPLASQRVVIVNPDTSTPRDPGEIGEIWVSGPSVAHGYWKQPEETERTFGARLQGDGDARFLRTGDLGFLWQGELFICGRLKDLIIRAGHKYHPHDIELSAEQGHAALRPGCGAAFAVEADGAEKLVIVYEVRYGPRPDPGPVIGSIQQAVTREHNLFADAVVLIKPGTLPKTTSGKIRRRSCAELFRAGRLEAIGTWQSWS